VNWFAPEELLWLFERAFLPLDLVCFGVEAEAVGYPALVPAKDQDFAVAESKAANRVARSPLAILVH
jgi:hypothetical protein